MPFVSQNTAAAVPSATLQFWPSFLNQLPPYNSGHDFSLDSQQTVLLSTHSRQVQPTVYQRGVAPRPTLAFAMTQTTSGQAHTTPSLQSYQSASWAALAGLHGGVSNPVCTCSSGCVSTVCNNSVQQQSVACQCACMYVCYSAQYCCSVSCSCSAPP